jgi:hypothetical protein
MGSGADMDKDYLALKRASASRPSGTWSAGRPAATNCLVK